MNNNIITFILPTIGRESLTDSIVSLLKQTNPNRKCILIFDGISIIPTIEYGLTTYSLINDDRFILHPIKKSGYYNETDHTHRIGGQAGLVRNAGLDIVQTNWVGFLDDDDTIDSKYVETLYSKYHQFDIVIWRMLNYSDEIFPPLDCIDEVKIAQVGISFCYKMNNLSKVRFKENDGGEDYYFLTTLIEKDNNYIIASEIFYYVKCNPYNAKKRLVSMSNNLSSIQINNLI